jgi:hypothetical protein
MSKKVQKTLGYSPWGCMQRDIRNLDFLDIFTHRKSIEDGMDGVDAMLLWGGADIHPSYYNQTPHSRNGAPLIPSERDIFEWKAMLYCKANNIPMIGICRGAQFLCAFAGGKLIQHIGYYHGHDHTVETSEGEIRWVTSTHHQMMYPYDVPHELLAWTHNSTNHIFEGEGDKPVLEMKDKKEAEIVFFPEIRALAIQGHPEYDSATPGFKDLCGRYAKKYIA